MYEHAVNIHDLDLYLGPYPTEKWDAWQQGTNYITQAVLDKLDPIVPSQIFTIDEEYREKDKKKE